MVLFDLTGLLSSSNGKGNIFSSTNFDDMLYLEALTTVDALQQP